jgi:2-polyprenyl-3-methyl-5-hydroxy-6-metoxy-1,4-benzoquinol methylase
VKQEQIERRLADNLHKDNPSLGLSSFESAPAPYMGGNFQLEETPAAMTFTQRLRYTIVVKILHRINLTSHRRLQRAYAAVDEIHRDLTIVIQQRDESARLLRKVAEDRDRIAAQLQQDGPVASQNTLEQYKQDQLKTELETLRTAHVRLQENYENLRSAYDEISHKNTALEAVMNFQSSGRVPNTEETITLPFTLTADAVIPYSDAVEHQLTKWGEIEVEDETDAFYFVLETSLRGSEQEIKQRQKEYLPYLKIVDPTLPLIDLGCGRGEFLELMREQGIRAVGVDTNSKNIQELKQKNFEIYQQDAVEYLESVAPNSLAAITAFQVIEHVSNSYLHKLVKLAYEKLTPGGFILLETVNPYCLETYRTFYLDPTHQKPVPLDLLSILYQFYGFADKQAFFQSPIKPTAPVSQKHELKLLYQGYGLMGTKPPTH